eukprot:Gb_41772 [translate_table: standard]
MLVEKCCKLCKCLLGVLNKQLLSTGFPFGVFPGALPKIYCVNLCD